MQKAAKLREPAPGKLTWAAFPWEVTYVPISLLGKLVQWDLVHLTIFLWQGSGCYMIYLCWHNLRSVDVSF